VGIVFKKGKLYKRVPSEELMDTLIEEVEAMVKEQDAENSGGLVSPASPLTSSIAELSLASPGPSSREIPVLPLK
jgi:hypothetical protein